MNVCLLGRCTVLPGPARALGGDADLAEGLDEIDAGREAKTLSGKLDQRPEGMRRWVRLDRYGRALARACAGAVDPQLQVLLGGLAGVDINYLDTLYVYGAGANFDVLNVHPYRYPGDPEFVSGGRPPLVDQIELLRETMERNGDTQKPIWFTEIGWPTHEPTTGQTLWSGFIRNCLRSLDGARVTWKVAYLDDSSYPPSQTAPISDALLNATVPGGETPVERIDLGRVEMVWFGLVWTGMDWKGLVW